VICRCGNAILVVGDCVEILRKILLAFGSVLFYVYYTGTFLATFVWVNERIETAVLDYCYLSVGAALVVAVASYQLGIYPRGALIDRAFLALAVVYLLVCGVIAIPFASYPGMLIAMILQPAVPLYYSLANLKQAGGRPS